MKSVKNMSVEKMAKQWPIGLLINAQLVIKKAS